MVCLTKRQQERLNFMTFKSFKFRLRTNQTNELKKIIKIVRKKKTVLSSVQVLK